MGDGLQPGARRHRAVQVRGVEDQHPRDHRAEPRLLGRQGAARPRDLQGGARGRRADDRAPDRRRRHGAVPVAGPAPDAPARTRSSPCTRRPGSASSSSGFNASMPPLDDVRVRQALLHAVDRKAILDNIVEGSACPRTASSRPACSATRTCSSTSSIPFDRAKAKALLAQAGWTPGPGRHPPEGRAAASLSWLAAARPLSQGRRDHRGHPGHVQGGRGRGQGASSASGRPSSTQFRASPLNHHMFTFGWVTSNADADYSLYALVPLKQVPPTGWNTLALREPAGGPAAWSRRAAA